MQSPDEPVLENPWVKVSRRHVAPGEALFPARIAPRTLAVFIRGGTARGEASGRAVRWREGRVAWLDGSSAPGEAWINAGEASMHLVLVQVLADAAARGRPPVPLDYPNVPGEDLLSNEYVLVQRFRVPPHTWEGVHGHAPNTLYIHITDARWAVRSATEPEFVYPEPSVAGEVDWMTPIAVEAGHESGNVGEEPVDIVWVSLAGG